jgi:hypothetical protein
MTAFVHLIQGPDPSARAALIARLTATARRPVLAFCPASDPPTGPVDWMMGPSCACCLAPGHARARLMAVASGIPAPRLVIDAGTDVMAARIASLLRALPVPLALNLITA